MGAELDDLDEIATTFGRTVITRLKPGADLMQSIKDICARNEIRAGVVLSITGSLEQAVVQKFAPGEHTVHSVTVPGPIEVSGHGILGRVTAPEQDKPFSFSGYRDGDVYAHVHLTMTSATETICGHAMPGCLIRSHHPVSHFSIIIAELEGVGLELAFDPEVNARGNGWGVYHRLSWLPGELAGHGDRAQAGGGAG
jgi:predicted DNA-binding protein with PD1-like motif